MNSLILRKTSIYNVKKRKISTQGNLTFVKHYEVQIVNTYVDKKLNNTNARIQNVSKGLRT